MTVHDFFVGHDRSPGTVRGAFAPARVADLMSRQVLTAAPQQSMLDLMATFSDGGRHHLPVVDGDNKLLGMVTQSDMVAALFRAGLERPA